MSQRNPKPYPDRADHHKRWVQVGRDSVKLHRVAEMVDDWEADGFIPIGGQGVTCCGAEGRVAMPGVISRLGAPRCKVCCRVVGIPSGVGVPGNDSSLTAADQLK